MYALVDLTILAAVLAPFIAGLPLWYGLEGFVVKISVIRNFVANRVATTTVVLRSTSILTTNRYGSAIPGFCRGDTARARHRSCLTCDWAESISRSFLI